MIRNLYRLGLVGGTAAALLFAANAASAPVYAKTPKFVVNTTDDTTDVNPGDGDAADDSGNTSLRAAIQEANALGGRAIVVLAKSTTYTLTAQGSGEDGAATGDLDVTGDLTIVGGGSTVDAAGDDRAFDVLSDGSLTASDLTIQNGFVSTASGGGIQSAGELKLTNVGFAGCVASGTGASGGGVFNSGGALTVSNCGFGNNQATRAGGAIESNAGSTTIDRCTFNDNTAGASPGNGGAFHQTGEGTIVVRRSAFTGNEATTEGGALWNSSTGNMTVDSCTFTGNNAFGPLSDDGGGAIFNSGGTLTVRKGRLENNAANDTLGSGGGIFNLGGTLTVEGVTFVNNVASRAGGGIESSVGTVTLTGVTMDGNRAGTNPGNGGGLHLTGAGTITVERSKFLNNLAAAEGGGLWNSSTGTMTITKSTFTANVAGGAGSDQGGGGVFNDGGTLSVAGSKFSSNVADGAAGSGGGLLHVGGSLTLGKSSFLANTAVRAGGGVEIIAGTCALSKVKLLKNTAGSSPGNGGGLHTTGASTVTVDKSSALKNTAANEGGGFWCSATGTLTVTKTKIAGNTAPDGPDNFNKGGTFTVDGVAIDGPPPGKN